ncbi:AraC family transcriptional regulator [Campylobacter sp. 9BO]|uniref:AraC family transcriptional regulator n=1 Tax=Campylobacter sp. 9BO TaxID=3424759 RepID=UPI003D3396F4
MNFLAKRDGKIIIVISVVFFLFLMLNYYFNYMLLKDNIQRYETELFSRVHTKIQDWTSANFKDVERIAKLIENENVTDIEHIQPLLFKYQQSSSYPYLIMGLEDGSFYISDKDYVTPHNYDLKSRDWYNDTLKAGSTIASNPYISMRLGLRSVSICTPIKVLQKRGVMCGGQPFEFICGYFKEYQTLYDENLYLVNKGGEILASFANLNETISFENIDIPNDKYASLPIKNTNWSVVFERKDELYTNELGKYLLINLLLYIFCILIYIFINLFWFKKNIISTKQLDEQNLYIKDVLTKQVNGIFVSCDENLLILSKSIEFENFYLFQKNQSSIEECIIRSDFLDEKQKQFFIEEIKISQSANEIRYFHINAQKDNEIKKYLITAAPFGNQSPYGLSLLFQDISSLQETRNDSNEFYNLQIEKLLIFIKENLDDESLCIEKLAKISGYSKFHLQRMFKNYMNVTIAEYLRKFRLSRAEFLLKFTDEKINTITKKCGFGHNETFIRSFSKQYLKTPMVYKQNLPDFPNNQLIFEELLLPSIKLAITHKDKNIDFLRSKQKHDKENLYILVQNASLSEKIYGTESNDANLSYIELKAGKWAKINLKASGLDIEDAILKANKVFYDPKIYNFSTPQCYYIMTFDANIEFLYIKI